MRAFLTLRRTSSGCRVTSACAAAPPPPPLLTPASRSCASASTLHGSSTSALTSSARYRSHLCGELSASYAQSQVSLCGWVQAVRPHGADMVFVTLRDSYGEVQLLVASAAGGGVATRSLVSEVAVLRLETVVRVVGRVALRPPSAAEGSDRRPAQREIEVHVASLEVLGNVTSPLPFTLSPLTAAIASIPEDTRLAHRSVDLRRAVMARNLRARSAVAAAIRSFLLPGGGCSPSFIEVEVGIDAGWAVAC